MRPEAADSAARIELAEQLLQEAVYRSRGEQAGAALLHAPPSPKAPSPKAPSASPSAQGPPSKEQPPPGRCGLGEKAAVVLDLTPRAETLFGELFPAGLDAERLEALRGALASWVRRQDALDRRRNHFLKDFRTTHGFQRSLYEGETLAAFEGGLARINAEAVGELREAAVHALRVAAA